MSQTFTSEFHAEFEAERVGWLRRRFLWYAGVVIILGLINFVPMAIAWLIPGAIAIGGTPDDAGVSRAVRLGIGVSLPFQIVSLGMYVAAFVYVFRRSLDREQTLRLTTWLIVLSGLLTLVSTPIMIETLRAGGLDPANTGRAPIAVAGLASVFSLHFFACLFLPWTPRESIRPMIPLLVANLLVVIIYAPTTLAILLTLALSPIVVLPGIGVCWWRHGRFRNRFMIRTIRGRYYDMKRELVDARRIHESLFPKVHLEGPVSFDYRYEPMRQIGGDFLYRRFAPSPHGEQSRLSVVIIDVTGHGIPAALTVNRLHGELERLFAENPDTTPGALLDALNRYVHLTLSEHSVYVTALCIRIDPNLGVEGALEFASGGHPPAFIRTVDGRIEQLNSTAFVLGAVPTEAFDAGQVSVRFGPGDTLIAYTDGAIEARDQKGKMIRIEGMMRLVASPSTWANGSAAQGILDAVDRHRFGPIADDTLIVELSRVLRSAGAAPLTTSTTHHPATTR